MLFQQNAMVMLSNGIKVKDAVGSPENKKVLLFLLILFSLLEAPTCKITECLQFVFTLTENLVKIWGPNAVSCCISAQ